MLKTYSVRGRSVWSSLRRRYKYLSVSARKKDSIKSLKSTLIVYFILPMYNWYLLDVVHTGISVLDPCVFLDGLEGSPSPLLVHFVTRRAVQVEPGLNSFWSKEAVGVELLKMVHETETL